MSRELQRQWATKNIQLLAWLRERCNAYAPNSAEATDISRANTWINTFDTDSLRTTMFNNAVASAKDIDDFISRRDAQALVSHCERTCQEGASFWARRIAVYVGRIHRCVLLCLRHMNKEEEDYCWQALTMLYSSKGLLAEACACADT